MTKSNPFLIIFIAVALFMTFAAVSVTADDYTYTCLYSFQGTGTNAFNGPYGVVWNPSNLNGYITDSNNNRFQEYLIEPLPNKEKWRLTRPLTTTKPSNESARFNFTTGIAANSTGTIFITDTNNNRISVWNQDGTFVTDNWTNATSGDPRVRLNHPYGIAVSVGSGDYIYVADTWNNSILKLTKDGKYVTRWATVEGTGSENTLDHPMGIIVGQNGNVYVSDTDNNRIMEYDANGTHLISKWENPQYNPQQFQFVAPQGLSVDADGNIYVANTGAGQFLEFSKDGKYLGHMDYGFEDRLHYPTGISVDKKRGLIYVTDYGRYPTTIDGAVNVYSVTSAPPSGPPLTFKSVNQWGTPGTGSGQFSNPTGIAKDIGGNIYVVDNGNSRIQKFSSTGTFITQWGKSGSGVGQFNNPQGIATDQLGFVYVVDSGNNRVQKFNALNGAFVTQWGKPGSGNGQFYNPVGINVSTTSSGITDVYVVDSGNNRVEKFSTTGVYEQQFGSHGSGPGQFETPWGITTDVNGNIFVSDSGNNRIEKFFASGAFSSTMSLNDPNNNNIPITINKPKGIATGSNTDIYVVDSGNNRFVEFKTDGTLIGVNGSYGYGNYLAALGKFNKPDGITIGPNGNIYVADSGNNRVQEFYTTWPYSNMWGSYGGGISQFYHPWGIAVHGLNNNNVYVVDTGNNRIQQFTPDGDFVRQWGSYGVGNGASMQYKFYQPSGIAVDNYHRGEVYVTDTGNNRVMVYDQDGNYQTEWGSFGHGDNMFVKPTGIAVDTDGNVYVADSGNYRITEFTLDGAYVRQWGTRGNGDGEFGYAGPTGIAIIPATLNVPNRGNIIVADYGNNRVQMFTNTGEFVKSWGSPGPRGSPSGGINQTYYPQGIAVRIDPGNDQGDILVVDRGNNRVQEFDDNGNYLTEWGSYGTTYGMFNQPGGIATNSTGAIYVTDTNNNRVQRFTLLTPPPVPKIVTPTPTPVIPMKADFSVLPLSGGAVLCQDLSTGNPTSWIWSSSNGQKSTSRYFLASFSSSGTYTITLKVTGKSGTSQISKQVYVSMN